MTTQLREERVLELGESSYLMLRDGYGMVQQLKGLVDRLHANYLKQGVVFEMDTVMAIKLTTDTLYDEMERYLRPECDPDSAYDEAMTEEPS